MALRTRDGILTHTGPALNLATGCCCCCEFIPCGSEGEEESLFVLCGTLPEGIQIGDVVKIGDTCYEYAGDAECFGGESSVEYDEVFETCDDCVNQCCLYEPCPDQDEDEPIAIDCSLVLDDEDNPYQYIKVGDICYSYEGKTSCEDELDPGAISSGYEDCEDCLAKCGSFQECNTHAFKLYKLTQDFLDAVDDGDIESGDIVRVNGSCYEFLGIVACDPDTEEMTSYSGPFIDCTACEPCDCCDGGPPTCTVTFPDFFAVSMSSACYALKNNSFTLTKISACAWRKIVSYPDGFGGTSTVQLDVTFGPPDCSDVALSITGAPATATYKNTSANCSGSNTMTLQPGPAGCSCFVGPCNPTVTF